MRLAMVSAAALAAGAAISEAQAGGFGVREQSTQYQGTSFAGSATGGDLSSMFWNPAAAASADGINTVSSYTFAAPDSHLTATGGAFLQEGYNARSGSYSGDFLIPASYANYQLNDRWYLGLALNSPFGFVTKPSNQWAGSPIETTSKVFSVDINPNLAYKITPQLTIGVGIQIEYFKLCENSAGGALPVPLAGLDRP